MRWAYIGLICLGLIAAAAAAVLVAGIQRRAERPSAAQVEHQPRSTVVTAARELEAMTVVDGNLVSLKQIPANSLPEGGMTAPEQVIGKVLAISMQEDQAFTDKCFVAEGSGPQMAAVLSRGKRAVSVSLPDHSALQGLLYPGCLVDVLLSTEVEEAGRRDRRFVSVPLLQRIQVLAVGNETVFSNPGDKKEKESSSRGRLLITLMVDPDQARALRLGQERGSLSLAMSNPFDQDDAPQTPLQIHDVVGGLPNLASTAGGRRLAQLRTKPLQEAREEPSAQQEPEAVELPPRWEVMVIRGGQAETQQFEEPQQRD